MQWALYGIVVGIAALAGKMWIYYMKRMDALVGDQRRLRRSIQQHRLAIEACERREALESERVAQQEEEARALCSELAEAEALLSEMIRKEQRRNPDAFAVEAELHVDAELQLNAGGGA